MKKLLLLAGASMLVTQLYSQTKKVLLEDFTGRWCQYCPNGSKAIEDLEALYPSTFLAVATHNANGDQLEIPDGAAIVAGLNVTGYPNGAIDRKLISGSKIPIGINANGTQWKSAVATRITTPAIVSVSFANAKKNGTTYEADVKVKFTSAPTTGVPLALQVYILEDSIEATVANGLKQTNSTTWYGGGNPLVSPSFYHNNTLRQALGGAWGWTNAIPATPTVNMEYTKHISFTLPTTGTVPAGGWKAKNIKLYAFVSYNGTAAADKKEVLNAEKIKLSSFFPTGVNDVENIDFTSVYPNPASVNQIINMEYNIKSSAEVTLTVYNALGQIVARPYRDSKEVKGTHTITWRASDFNLSPGLYIAELSTSDGGKKLTKLNLH